MRVITSSGNQIMDGKDWGQVELAVKTAGGGDTCHQPMPKECPVCGCKRMVSHPSGRKGLYECTKCGETISRNYITPRDGSWAQQESAKKQDLSSDSLHTASTGKGRHGMEQVDLKGMHAEIDARQTRIAATPRTDLRLNSTAFRFIQENYPNIFTLFKQADSMVINAMSMVIDDIANGSSGSFQGLVNALHAGDNLEPNEDNTAGELG